MSKEEILKRSEILESGHETRIAADEAITADNGVMYDILAVDMASLDDGGWQVRETYISKHDCNKWVLLAHGDGYSGFAIGNWLPGQNDRASVRHHLSISDDMLADIIEIVQDKHDIHLNSTDWDMLEALQDDAKKSENYENN